MMKKIFLYFLVGVSCNSLAFAQEQPKINFEKVVFQDHFGYPYTEIWIECSLQDQRGFIWIGTSSGLQRFNGYSITSYTYDPKDSTTLPSNYITSLLEDKEGDLWVGTGGGGLAKFNPKSEKTTRYYHHAVQAGLHNQWIEAIGQDRDGMIWIGTKEGASRFDPKSETFTRILHDPDNPKSISTTSMVTAFFQDKDGDFWIGTNNKGLNKVDRMPEKNIVSTSLTFTHFSQDPNNPQSLTEGRITSICEDHFGTIWIATTNGLNQLEKLNGSITRYQQKTNTSNSLSNNFIYPSGLEVDGLNNLWIATEHGLNKLNPKRTQFTAYFHDPSDPNSKNWFRALLVDQQGMLWAYSGTSHGLYKIDLKKMPIHIVQTDLKGENPFLDYSIIAAIEDKEGNIWIGTRLNGLFKYDQVKKEFTNWGKSDSSTGLTSNIILSLLEDSDGNLWVGQLNHSGEPQGISFLDRQTGHFQHFPSEGVTSMLEDKKGIIWFGTYNGLKSYDRSIKEWKDFPFDPTYPKGISDQAITAIAEDHQGNLWMATENGLNRFDPISEEFFQYKYNHKDPTSISDNTLRALCVDRKGNLWIGTGSGGLCLYNPASDNFTTFSQKVGLPDNRIHAIIEDDQGNLWIGTDQGTCRFSPSTIVFENVDFLNSDFERGWNNPIAKGSSGIIYLIEEKGLGIFHPRDLDLNQKIPPVYITQFKLFDLPQPGKHEEQEINLNYDENFFSFEFAALNYIRSEKNQYAYQLIGVDKEWVNSGSRRIATYTDIAPGTYIFQVKGSNNAGIWNEEGAVLTIVIHPPWWRTWWAYAVYFIFFMAGVYAIDRYQRKRLIQREEEKARERELVHAHEIEKAYITLKQTQAQLIQSEKMASLGELTAGIAHEIQNPLNFVNNFSEVSAELVEEMKEELAVGNGRLAVEIAEDIKQNLEKINHHGKRADAIVKGMLEHSRASSGEKVLTDINALADEYLRLSYHGMRAKDKNFIADFKTDFDPNLPKVNVVPQDIGRVLLNIINNAFQACAERPGQSGVEASLSASSSTFDIQHSSFEIQNKPQVIVSTKNLGNTIQISISDNGPGIPDAIKDKIFQPFFTTKPTGQGTGLGLSLSYDIVKAQGGEIKVETKEGEGSEFTIQMPFTKNE